MGVIAFVRQSFLDAQHYAVRQRIPTTRRSKPCNRSSHASCRWRSRRTRRAEILRVLKMAKELNIEPIVAGGRGASEVTADLKAQNVRVIYSLNYPQRPRALAPDADETLETLRDRADAPKTPSALAKAGVSFAFESAGLSDPKDFVKNAAKAIKAGLAEETAIRAPDARGRDDRRRRRPPGVDRERQDRESRCHRRQSLRRENESHACVRRGPRNRAGARDGPDRAWPGPRRNVSV